MQKQLVNFGGVEENDRPPMAQTLVMDISKTSMNTICMIMLKSSVQSGKTSTGRWTVANVRKPDPKLLGMK